MEHIIFGFGTEIRQYLEMEIFLYLILFSLMTGIVGKAAYGKKVNGQYMALIRYGTYAGWWHSVVLWVLKISVLLAGALFAGGAALLHLAGVTRTGAQWQTAFLLWLTGFCTIALIQAVFIQFQNGYKIIFALVMCMAVVSLYIPGLPGSWIMYERSAAAMENGFSIRGVCLSQIGIDIIIGCFGHYLFRPRRGHESGN